MQVAFNLFYRGVGIRRPQQLLSPIAIAESSLTLPRNSILHYTERDANQTKLTDQMTIFGPYQKRIVVDHIAELIDPVTKPSRNSTQIQVLARDFHQKNKKFRYGIDSHKTTNDPTTLVVFNYSFLDDLYRYVKMPMTDYWRWLNVQKTMWATIEEVCKVSDREHFVMVDLPLILPSFTSLNRFAGQTDLQFYKNFDTPEKLFVMEIWKWLSEENKNNSVLAKISDNNLFKVNFIFRDHGKLSVLNLGYLQAWLSNSTVVNKDAGSLKLNNLQLQKFFLKFSIQMKMLSETPEEEPPTESPIEQEETAEDDEDRPTPNSVFYAGFANPAYGNKPLKPTSGVQTPAQTPQEPEEEPEQLFNLQDELANIDEDLKTLDLMEKKSKMTDIVSVRADDSVKGEVVVPEGMVVRDTLEEEVYKPRDFEEALIAQIDDLAEYGLMSAAEYRATIKQIQTLKQLPDPYGIETTIGEACVVKPEDLALTEQDKQLKGNDVIMDPSMISSVIKSYDKKYAATVLPKDVLRCVVSTQKAGFVILSHTVETESSITGEYEYHVIKVKPIDGAASTLRFKLPKVNDEGIFEAGNTKYVMRKQRTDLPIRKIKPTVVGLSSYYGKTFVSRSTKKANDPISWIARQVIVRGMSGESDTITSVSPADVYDNQFKAPHIYSALSGHFKAFTCKDIKFVFDHRERHLLYSSIGLSDASAQKAQMQSSEKNGMVTVGVTADNKLVFVDTKGNFHVSENNQLKLLGTIYTLTDTKEADAPINFAELKVFSKTIPIGVVLAYLLGFDNLLKFLRVEYRTVEPRKVKNLRDDEWVLAFKDIQYIFSRRDEKATLILAGFLQFEKSIKNYFQEAFNNKNVYLNILDSQSISVVYLRELELMDQLFVDPITAEILEYMKEPQTFRGLVVRSAEMLMDHNHKNQTDLTEMRIRGYERFAGAVYKEMVVSIRSYKARNIRGKSQMEMNPYAVWRNVMDDQSKKMVEEINPIQNVKEKESVTFAGEGGRSKDSMNKASRVYDETDMGTISEATVDSSDVGINTYLSANPNLINLRGVTKPIESETNNYSSLISTSALLSPGAMNDDIKRVGFISIQHGHTVATDGYHQAYVRTGYETLLAQRTGEMFAYSATDNGKVISKNEHGILVEYVTGEKRGVNIGRRFGKAEGSVYPHTIVSPMEVGQTFEKGDVIAYNTGFFEPDMLDPKRVVWKTSMSVKTALYESSQTHEDSCSVSKKTSERMSAKTTKVKSMLVDFNQQIHRMVAVGTQVEPETVLCILEDEATAGTDMFDEETLDTLKRLSNKAPKSKYKGVVERIEVYYHGEKEDMSPSLRKLANDSDKLFGEISKSVGKKAVTGSVDSEYRVEGTPLGIDQAEIKIYITVTNRALTGDKGVFGNQMKSVIGEVIDYPMTTESGEDIEAVFGYKGIFKRIVHSPAIIGTTTTLLKVLAKRAVSVYRGK